MHRVLFVCTENANRSQMAEAFMRVHAQGRAEVESAGSRPAERINPVAVQAMRERGYDMAKATPSGLDSVGDRSWDYVVTMGCDDACPWIEATGREDWELRDPRGMTLEELREVRDEIEERVLDLVQRLDDG